MSKRKKSLAGLVWFGFTGEYQNPPCYIIVGNEGWDNEEMFISDVLKEFAGRKVEIIIKEV